MCKDNMIVLMLTLPGNYEVLCVFIFNVYTTKYMYAFNLNKCKPIQHKLVQVHELICCCFMIDVQYVIIGAKKRRS